MRLLLDTGIMQIRSTSLQKSRQTVRPTQASHSLSAAPKDSFSFSKVDSDTVKFWAKAAPFSLVGVGLGAGSGSFVGKVVGRGLGEVTGHGASFEAAGTYLGAALGAMPGGYFGTFLGVSLQV